MQITNQTAKALLNKLVTLSKAPNPVYSHVIDKGPPAQNVCTLEVPRLEIDGHISEPQSFTAAASSKKTSSIEAAVAAMETLISVEWVRSLLEDLEGPATLLGATTRALSPEGVRKDPDLEGNLVMAQEYNGGWLPRTLLAKSKLVARWYKEKAKQPNDVMHICQTLIPLLRAELAEVQDAEIEVDSLTGMIRHTTRYTGRQHTKTWMLPALLETNRLGDGKEFTAVLIPADDRMPVEEVSFSGGAWHLQAIAAILKVEVQSLVCWGREGKSYCTTMLPDELSFDLTAANEALKIIMEKHMTVEDMREPIVEKATTEGEAHAESVRSAEKALREKVADEERRRSEAGEEPAADVPAAAPRLATPGDEDLDIRLSPRLDFQEIRSPFMYSSMDEEAPINRRASWLVGSVVRGPLVLANTYVRPMPLGLPCIKWQSFSERAFWRWLSGSAPHTLFLHSVGHAQRKLATWLPHAYSTWLPANRPATILEELSCPGVMKETPRCTYCPAEDVEDTDTPLQTCKMSCKLLGSDQVLQVEGEPATTEMGAWENAALEMLHLLQAAWRDLFFCSVETTKPEEPCSIEVLDPGKPGRPVEGGAVYFNYTITSPQLGDIVLEEKDITGIKMLWGPAMMCLPEMHSALRKLGASGKARICMPLPLDGKAVGGPHTPVVPSVIDIELLKWQQPAVRATAVTIFSPRVAAQRYTFIGDILKAHRVRSVVDVGCGTGSLIEHIIKNCPEVEDICGMDISPQALEKAAKKLAGESDDCMERSGNAPSGAPKVRFLLEDAFAEGRLTAGGWDDLGQCDVAIMTEVIEHLDPEPLALLPAAILGSLRPPLVVVTTPNKDYNPIMHKLGVSVPPGCVRNSDHRFEWTQKEFRDWADRAAAQHGYSVTYDGIGRAAKEETVLDGLTPEEVGMSTQVAIFTRKQDSVQHEYSTALESEHGAPPSLQGSGKRRACDDSAAGSPSEEPRAKMMKAC